jgi:dGTPase
MIIKGISWKNGLVMLRADDSKAERIFEDHNHLFRSNYQHDRDRIIFSESFRRLIGKTQVFNVGIGEHYRNRLTHTLEVMQIATTIAKCLGLNIELTEAIALGHDIGHAPFGHVGERTLNYIMNECDIVDKYNIKIPKGKRGFKHNLQGLRILCNIEKHSKNFHGMNITNNTLWGIKNHSRVEWKKCEKITEGKLCLMRRDRKEHICFNDERFSTDFYNCYWEDPKISDERAWTLEAYVVKIADEIAQRHHDIEDGIYAGIIEAKDFIEFFKDTFKDAPSYKNKGEVEVAMKKLDENIQSKNDYILPSLRKFFVHFYVKNYILAVAKTVRHNIIDKYKIKNNIDFYDKKMEIWKEEKEDGINKFMDFSESYKKPDDKVKDWLKIRILNSRKAQLMDGKGGFIIRKLFEAYLTTPNQLPDHVVLKLFIDYKLMNQKDKVEDITEDDICSLRDLLGSNRSTDNDLFVCLCRNICDYISSMTDIHALKQYEKLYGSTILT